MSLERRLQKLESIRAVQSGQPTRIFVSYIDADPSADGATRSRLARIIVCATDTHESESFDRLPNETEPAFLARVGASKGTATEDKRA